MKYMKLMFLLLTSLVLMPALAAAEDVSVSVEFYPNNQVSGTPITLILKGKLYPDDYWFDQLAKNQVALSEDEKFVVAAVQANASASSVELLNIWSPDERDAMAPLIFDTQMFDRNQGWYKRIVGSAFLARILYGDYTIYLVQHDLPQGLTVVKDYPIHKVDGKYYMTNKLANDPVFMYLTQKYKKTLPLKTRQVAE